MSLQDHPHWMRIRWVPFVSPPVGAADVIANVLLYVPFGYFAGRFFRDRRWVTGIVGAALLSCSTEMTQVFGHGRFPSVQDLSMNVLGAAIGIWVSQIRNVFTH